MFACGCPRLLAFKTVGSYIGQLRAILRDHLEARELQFQIPSRLILQHILR